MKAEQKQPSPSRVRPYWGGTASRAATVLLSNELSTATMKERTTPLLARQAPRGAAIATTGMAHSTLRQILVRCADCGHSEIRGTVMQGAATVAAWTWCCNFVTSRNVKNRVRRAPATSVKLVGNRSLKPATVTFVFDVVDLATLGRAGARWQARLGPIGSGPLQERHAMVRGNVLPGESLEGMGR